jgi:hypothetical protein
MEKQQLHPNEMLTEQWAILYHHPLGPEVVQQSVTPWFVGDPRNTVS